ncbi:hypothetical protein D3C85_1723000 [compost metagenome]
MCNVRFALDRQRLNKSILIVESNDVRIHAKTRTLLGYIVPDDQITVFALQLVHCMLVQRFRFRSKSDDKLLGCFQAADFL